jgi:CobQ-like glutamine amidotransferase family enzyme
LAISKVDAPREASMLSRNNTIADFLSTEAMREKGEQHVVGLEVRNLRQTIKRMQQILEE